MSLLLGRFVVEVIQDVGHVFLHVFAGLLGGAGDLFEIIQFVLGRATSSVEADVAPEVRGESRLRRRIGHDAGGLVGPVAAAEDDVAVLVGAQDAPIEFESQGRRGLEAE